MRLRTALAILIIVTAYSSYSAGAETGRVGTSGCTSSIKKSALATVKGQVQALSKEDFKTALAFAAASFRAQVSLAEFTNIITESYSFLGDTTTFKIIECELIEKSVSLGLRLTDGANTTHIIFYLLSPQRKRELLAPNKTGYGIAGAQLGQNQALSKPIVNTNSKKLES